MAGGKQTPRQKMVNLMYLVFIAMMALNMSKEVLSAFGLMNEQFESSNVMTTESNDQLYQSIAKKAGEDATFKSVIVIADKVKAISADFYAYVETLKKDVTKDIELEKGKLPYEQMDKGDKIDESWFVGDGYSAKGKEIVAAIDKYKSDMKAAVGTDGKYQFILNELDSKFTTADVTDREGVKKKYLDYHFKGFPAIASLTKLSAMQNNVKTMETNIYNIALGKAAVDAASFSKSKAIVVLDKNAYFQGEKVTGKVVLGRYDPNIQPTAFDGPGKIENGQAIIDFSAAGIGEHDIKGKFVFTEDGKPVPLEFSGSYVVVPKPNSATISADKMNSVYRGVDNPISVSFAGIPDSDVTVNAPGIKKGAKPGQYNWNVTSLSGTEAIVTVTGKLSDGSSVSDKKKFVIRDIPKPQPSIRGKSGSHKGSKADLAVSTVNVEFPDFVYDVNVTVESFELFVPGNPMMIVQGNKFNAAAQAAINKASRGDVITVGNIKTKLVGATYRIKDSGVFQWVVQ